MGFWYTFGSQIGELLGFHLQASGTKTVGAAVFWSAQFLWFYLYFIVTVGLFASTWMLLSPHPWSRWSILGSAIGAGRCIPRGPHKPNTDGFPYSARGIGLQEATISGVVAAMGFTSTISIIARS